MGIGFWIQETSTLRQVIEKLAKQQFIQSGRDPHACFLFYAALNKSKLLAGLFQISRDSLFC